MNARALFFFIAVLVFVGGCATRPVDPLVARREAYDRLRNNIRSGMTRRQLYALLPPRRTPEILPPLVDCGKCWFYKEMYSLDRDFSLEVEYHLANASDFIARDDPGFSNFLQYIDQSWKRTHLPIGDKPRMDPLKIGLPQFDHPKLPRSRENLDDEITAITLSGPNFRGLIGHF